MKDDETLEERFNFRLMPGMQARINEAVKNNPVRFDNPSHFCRVAVIKLLREVER